jgi:predicted small lipoprotein YifL
MSALWIRGMGLMAVLALAGCGGPIEEPPQEAAPGSQEQELRPCSADGQCGVNEVCRSGACYPCNIFPQYCPHPEV